MGGTTHRGGPPPLALLNEPNGVEKAELAEAPSPTARDWLPAVAAAQLTPPLNPVAVDTHCAKAGEIPSAVITPAIAARLRSEPPLSMLLASSWARELDG